MANNRAIQKKAWFQILIQSSECVLKVNRLLDSVSHQDLPKVGVQFEKLERLLNTINAYHNKWLDDPDKDRYKDAITIANVDTFYEMMHPYFKDQLSAINQDLTQLEKNLQQKSIPSHEQALPPFAPFPSAAAAAKNIPPSPRNDDEAPPLPPPEASVEPPKKGSPGTLFFHPAPEIIENKAALEADDPVVKVKERKRRHVSREEKRQGYSVRNGVGHMRPKREHPVTRHRHKKRIP